MAKVTTNPIGTGTGTNTLIDANFAAVVAAIENTLSRDGTSPNTMSADLDMNSNKILNLAAPSNNNDAVRLVDLSDSDATGAASAQLRSDLASTTTVSDGSTLVGHKHQKAGVFSTGAISRTLAAELNELIVPINRFNPTADGSTDDTAPITNLFTACSIDDDDSKRALFTTGHYRTTSGVTWNNTAGMITGEGISSRISGTNAHTLTVAANKNDSVICNLWIDQVDSSGSFDALHILGGETHIHDVDVDFAPRYGIYVGAFRTQICRVNFQACLDTCIYIPAGIPRNTITDVIIEDAGTDPGNGVHILSDYNSISGLEASNPAGFLLHLDGDYNVATGITGVNVGGTTAENFCNISGNFNTLTSLSAKGTTGVAYHISGGSNQLYGLVADNASKPGVVITGNNNSISGRLFNVSTGGDVVDTFTDSDVTTATDRITLTAHAYKNTDVVELTTTGTLPTGLALGTYYYVKSVDANTIELYTDYALSSIVDITAAAGGGTHTITLAGDGALITGDNNRVNLDVQTVGGTYDLKDVGAENHISGRYSGTVWMAGTKGSFEGSCANLVVEGDPTAASTQNNNIRATITGGTGVGLELDGNGNNVNVTVVNAGTTVAQIGGSSNIATIRGFGASSDAITLSGNTNVITAYISGSGGNDIVISGNNNVITGYFAGNVSITGDQNVFQANVGGDLTLSAAAQNNRVDGVVIGTLTDSGTGNVTTGTV